MDPELRTQPLIYVEDLDRPEIAPSDAHHFGRVRRLSDGSRVSIGDGRGSWRSAAFGGELTDLGAVRHEAPPTPTVTIAFTPVKGERPDWIVQKLTELGVDRIVPLLSERSVVRWDPARADKHLNKWRQVAREAGMQSRRLHLPVVEKLVPLASFRDAHPDLVLCEPGGPPVGRSFGAAVRDSSLVVGIGPEGGWSPVELEGAATVSLPGGILRAETAVLTAAAVFVGLRDSHFSPAS